MPSQNNLSVITNDGPQVFGCQVQQDGNPLPIGSLLVVIYLKSGQNVPDSSGVQFTQVNGGLQYTDPVNGLFNWIVPSSFFTEPGSLWYHGIVVVQGVQATWGFGSITITAA